MKFEAMKNFSRVTPASSTACKFCSDIFSSEEGIVLVVHLAYYS